MLEMKKYKSNHIVLLIAHMLLVSSLIFLSCSFAKNSSYHDVYNKAEKEIVRGTPVGSKKLVTGVARVVKSADDLKKINNGDIIVTIMTKELWSSALKKSSGIITNVGDNNCHAALYGKKNSIPVLVGAAYATEKISDGSVITLDCSQGTVGRVYEPDVMEKMSHINMNTKSNVCVNIYDEDSTLYYGDWYGQEQSTNGKATPELFNKHYKSFVSYVFDMRKTLNYWRSWGDWTVRTGAKTQCGPFEIKCIPLIYDLYDKDDKYIESIISQVEIDYVNLLYEKCSAKPGDKEWRAHVLHSEHIKKLSLPDDVSKEILIKDPEKYKEFIERTTVVSAELRHKDMIAGLFVRFCSERKITF